MADGTEDQMSAGLRRIFYREELPSDAASRIRRRLRATPAPQRRTWPVLVACVIGVPLMAMAPTLGRLIVTATGGSRGNPGLYGTVGKAAWRPLDLVVPGGGATLRCQAYYSDGWQTSLLCGMTGTSIQQRELAVGGMFLQDSAGRRVAAASYQAGNWPDNVTGVYTFFGSVTTGPAEIGFTLPGSPGFHQASFDLQKTTQAPVRRVTNAGAATAGGVTVTLAQIVAGPAATQVQWTASVPGSRLLLWIASGTPSLTAPGGWLPTGEASGGGAVDGVATQDYADPLPMDSATVTLPSFRADLFVPVDSRGTAVTPLKPFASGTVSVAPIPAAKGVAFRVRWTGVSLVPSAFVLTNARDGAGWMPEGCAVPGLAAVPWCDQSPSSSGTLELFFPEWPAGATPAALRVRSGMTVNGPWKIDVALPPPAPAAAAATW